MEEEDYEQLAIPNEHSPSDQNRKLKRLKRAFVAPNSPLSDPLLLDDEVKNPESASRSLDSTNSGDELLGSEKVSAEFEREKDSEEFDKLFPWEGERSGAKRALDFDDDDDDSSDENRMNLDSENQGSEGIAEVKKGGKKRVKSNGGDEEKKEKRKKKKKDDDKSAGADGKPKISRRKENQERKAEDAMLVDYQRQLRERRDVAFKPLPVVQRTVSSVLERIRQRKQQVSLKAAGSISSQLSDPLSEIMIDSDSEEVVIVKEEDCKNDSSSKGQVDPTLVKDDGCPSPLDKSDDDLSQLSVGHKSCQMPLVEDKEEPSTAFRQPTNDTQELFSESQTNGTQDDKSNPETGSSQDEDLAPSLPSMNLKLDSAPSDDVSSEEDEDDDDDDEEEENDKENINPLTGQLFRANLSPRGDPVKDFFDEEALEEDCSDDERRRFDDEIEDGSDAEEIAEMIATNYTEKQGDRERRNELHQMWLAQQDEAGTENLLQRLKCKAKNRDSTLLDEEDEGQNADDMDDEFGNEEDLPTKGNRLNIKQLRQMIPYMFTDKDDTGYTSSDDEETENRLNKQRLLGKVEVKDHAMIASPAENEATREVFGRIKKLNLVTETKKKVKTPSFFQKLVTKGSDSSNSSKSSFLNRMSSIPVSKRRASNIVKGFIFGRDDSNSKSSISASEEDSRDMTNQAEKSNPRKRTFTAKFSSQAKQSTQSRVEVNHSTSLIDILKRSSVQTNNIAQENIVDRQAAFAAFRPSKRPVLKVEARS